MKSASSASSPTSSRVAPLAGAWIEIGTLKENHFAILVAPLAGAWIEIEIKEKVSEAWSVAPLAGAWIEMGPGTKRALQSPLSLPSRERGLKLCKYLATYIAAQVAPHAGEWIEIN